MKRLERTPSAHADERSNVAVASAAIATNGIELVPDGASPSVQPKALTG